MVSRKSVIDQLKKLDFKHDAWGRGEVKELHNILLQDEEIYECANGYYEGGFALLLATNIRVLLVDKKPLNYLTVEDLRFDMINEIDYSHRLLGAQIDISTGSRDLRFRSYNQQRLRKLINHVQHCMAESKAKLNEHAEDQKQHLQEINNQLQTYLFAQQQQQQQLQLQLQQAQKDIADKTALPEFQPVRPSPKLADYLYAQSLLARHQLKANDKPAEALPVASDSPVQPSPATTPVNDLYQEGVREIFGKRQSAATPTAHPSVLIPPIAALTSVRNPLEVNALKIAYSKLPMALRNRKFGRPSFHAHSQAVPQTQPQQQPIAAQ
jgi:PH (Pleckstrin Homology) domain-containing protein